MKRVVFILNLSSLFLFSSVFAWEGCPATWEPVCGRVQTTCTTTQCSYTTRTYANSCYLAEAKGLFLYAGPCSPEKTQSLGTGIFIGPLSVATTSEVPTSSLVFSPQFPNSIVQQNRNALENKLNEQGTQEAKVIYLQKFLPRLQNQYDEMLDKTTAVAQNTLSLLGLVDQYIAFFEKQKVSSKPVVEARSYDFPDLGVRVSVPTYWDIGREGQNISIVHEQDRIDIEITTVLGSSSPSGKPLTAYSSGSFFASGDNLNLLFNAYIRDTYCPKTTGGKRTVGYKILAEQQVYSNAKTHELMFVCQEWFSQNGSLAFRSFYTSPITFLVMLQNGVYYIGERQQPRDGSEYENDIKKYFSLSLHPLLLGKNAQQYAGIIEELQQQNKEMAQTIFK